jgi:hypothetical protein
VTCAAKENKMFPKNSGASIAGVVAGVGSMFTVALADVQKGAPASKADLIPAAQLLNGSTGSTSSAAVIAYHLDMISGVDYRAAPDPRPLPRDGLAYPRRDPGMAQLAYWHALPPSGSVLFRVPDLAPRSSSS